MPWFFSYSDLGPQEVTTLLGKTPLCMLPATLAGYQISFKGKSRKWGGAVASLERSRKNFVYGSALLVPPDDLAVIENYYKGMKTELVPVFIDACQDKIKAVVCISTEGDYGLPSDEYIKALLKHLKFFWGQSGGKKPSLEDFGISLTPDSKPKKAEQEPEAEVISEEQPKRRRRSKASMDIINE